MPIDELFSSLQISASGLTSNRRWMDAIAENLANAKTTRTDQGGPYRRKVTTFQEVQKSYMKPRENKQLSLDIRRTQSGHIISGQSHRQPATRGEVEAQIVDDNADFTWVYDPDHPDANGEGYVAYPNVEVVREMVDLITASRAYEANVTAMSAAKAMHKKALEI
ncbi:flagellar basal body rod protein FlgC [candidate division LCP-89 bacterium B3_LCP]|uniref:Flagellar basal-body rod protein FlgC n=1 Tax=candidate division LCP-89 bacterium B3_LCP TaxID=2012998 RepID=A0A532V509_UNCL8|nr:MAG: flagellar basal body rod protein FlgC [candidate division LCP-89 bacterium B3_LCP]